MAIDTSNPIARYDAACENAAFVFVVFYRGSWCPFCQVYVKQLQSLTSRITAAGGHAFTVTSESEEILPQMRAATGYTGETIVDPQNLLAAELKRRGIIDVAVSETKGYPHGMVQPAVLVGGKGGVWFTWAIVPGVMNLGGAKDRPSLNEVWENAEAKMNGKPEPHKVIPLLSLLQGIGQKMFG